MTRKELSRLFLEVSPAVSLTRSEPLRRVACYCLHPETLHMLSMFEGKKTILLLTIRSRAAAVGQVSKMKPEVVSIIINLVHCVTAKGK